MRAVPALLVLLLLILVDAPLRAKSGDSSDAGRFAPHTPRRAYAVAAIGDSLTDTRVSGGRYLHYLKQRCPESRFDAYGVGGQQTLHMRWRFEQDVLGRGKPRYTHVIVLGGVNDLSVQGLKSGRISHTKANLAWMYQRAERAGIAVVALSVAPWGTFALAADRRLDATHRLNDWILEQDRQGRIAAALELAPLLSCGEADQLCYRYRRFGSDPIHWSEAGHKRVAEALYNAVFSRCE